MSKIDTFPLAGERVPENATNADTLDGNDSTFFLNASNLNAGSVPDAQVSAPSVQQHVTKAYVDGLGVDANTLDGLDSTAFAKLSGATFTGQIALPDPTSDTDVGDRGYNDARYGLLGVANTWTQSQVISKAAGDASLVIQADTDNNNDGDHPSIRLQQDNAATDYRIGLGYHDGDSASSWTNNLVFTCVTGAGPKMGFSPDNGANVYELLHHGNVANSLVAGTNMTITNNGDGTVTFDAAGGAVSSVFGRAGAVVAQSGDYTAAQVTNAADKSAANVFTADNNQFNYGISSNYSASGSSWGGSIWGMGTAHNGGISSTTHSILNMYGISWERGQSANANANAGEGLYVVVGGIVEAALGRDGIYVTGGGAFTGDPSFNTSDPRLKTEFLDFDSGSIIDAIEVGSYFWDKDKCLTAGFNHYDEHRHYGYNALDVYKTMGEYAAPIAPFDQDPKDKTKSKSGEEYRTGRDRELLSLALMEIKKLRKRVAELEVNYGL